MGKTCLDNCNVLVINGPVNVQCNNIMYVILNQLPKVCLLQSSWERAAIVTVHAHQMKTSEEQSSVSKVASCIFQTVLTTGKRIKHGCFTVTMAPKNVYFYINWLTFKPVSPEWQFFMRQMIQKKNKQLQIRVRGKPDRNLTYQCSSAYKL